MRKELIVPSIRLKDQILEKEGNYNFTGKERELMRKSLKSQQNQIFYTTGREGRRLEIQHRRPESPTFGVVFFTWSYCIILLVRILSTLQFFQ